MTVIEWILFGLNKQFGTLTHFILWSKQMLGWNVPTTLLYRSSSKNSPTCLYKGFLGVGIKNNSE